MTPFLTVLAIYLAATWSRVYDPKRGSVRFLQFLLYAAILLTLVFSIRNAANTAFQDRLPRQNSPSTKQP